MYDRDLVKAWLRQARADYEAATQPPSQAKDCHRRYWLQQANEKCIKALEIILWNKPVPTEPSSDTEAEIFKNLFLGTHSPLEDLRTKFKKFKPDEQRLLHALVRQVEVNINFYANSSLIRKVDSTSPSRDPMKTSYRYPFFDSHTAAMLAPVDWAESDWDLYQGNFQGVCAAVKEVLNDLDSRVRYLGNRVE